MKNVHSTAVGAALMSRFKNAFGTPPAPNTAARGCAACFAMLTTYGRLNKIGFTFTKKLSTGGDCCGFHFFKKQSTENRWSYVSNSKERAEWESDTAS